MPHSSIPSFRRRAARASLAKACVQHVLPAGVLAVLAAGCVVPRALAPSKAYWPTRWFREGFANYAGYHAARFVRDQATPWETASGPILWRGLAMQPFSKLAKVRTDLFRWNQRSSAAQDDDYYEAALGLFLLIEHHRGAAAVRSIIEALPSLKRPDGPAILKLCCLRRANALILLPRPT